MLSDMENVVGYLFKYSSNKFSAANSCSKVLQDSMTLSTQKYMSDLCLLIAAMTILFETQLF